MESPLGEDCDRDGDGIVTKGKSEQRRELRLPIGATPDPKEEFVELRAPMQGLAHGRHHHVDDFVVH